MTPTSSHSATIPAGAHEAATNSLVLSYLSVRRAIGLLGYFLPAALAAWSLLFGDGLLWSISDYYYTPMSEIFTGTLAAIAVFLWSYEGYAPRGDEWITDRRTARVASVAAIAIALAPVKPDAATTTAPMADCTFLQCQIGVAAASYLHYAATAAFFAALAVFCLVLFPRGTDQTPEKRLCNRIYRGCGVTILIAGAGIAICVAAPDPVRQKIAPFHPVFWFETLGILAFATSWAVKGKALMPLVRRMARG